MPGHPPVGRWAGSRRGRCPTKGTQVVFAEARERDVADHDDLVVALLEHHVDDRRGVDVQPGEALVEHAGDTLGRSRSRRGLGGVQQPRPCEDQADPGLDSWPVVEARARRRRRRSGRSSGVVGGAGRSPGGRQPVDCSALRPAHRVPGRRRASMTGWILRDGRAWTLARTTGRGRPFDGLAAPSARRPAPRARARLATRISRASSCASSISARISWSISSATSLP